MMERPMTLDIDDVCRRLSLALRSLSGAELPAVSAAADAKARAVTQYAALIAEAYASGALGEDEMRRELDEIELMTRRFAGAMKGLPGGLVDIAARRALSVIFGALRAGLSFAGAPLSEPLVRRIEARAAA
jgi:hypothetical protein